MKAVILSSTSIAHDYVVNQLLRELGPRVKGIVIEDDSAAGHSSKSLTKLRKRYSFLQISERILTKLYRKLTKTGIRQERAFAEVLGLNESDPHTEFTKLYVESVNCEQCFEFLTDIEPDYIFIFGTKIIGRKLMSIPKRCILNLHTGISPYYRGSGTCFWAIYNGELDLLGATVHDCTPDIDGGSIYERIVVRIQDNDDQFMAFARCIKYGGQAYAKIAGRLMRNEQCSTDPQDLSIGKEYKFMHQTMIHDLRMEYLYRSGKLRLMIRQSQNNESEFPVYGLESGNLLSK